MPTALSLDSLLTYQDYLNFASQRGETGSEGANAIPLSEEAWQALTSEQRRELTLDYGPLYIGADDPRNAQLRPYVGGEEGRDIVIYPTNLQEQGYLAPGGREYALGGGGFVHSQDAETPEFQEVTGTHGVVPWMVAVPFLGPLAFEGMAAAGLEGAGAADAFSGAVAGAEGGAVGAETGLAGTLPAYQTPEFLQQVLPAESGAGVLDGARAFSGSLADGATSGSGPMGWYNSLSPGARQIIGLGASQGASALMGARNQREAIRAADDRENRQREDRVRRGSIPSFGGAFTRRPGIIDGQRGGG